ncbi:FadR family transcriptional regulator [Noviherbaspirillum cavernae]|uniref:FadR family transcriptional regulator n=2 Tax=Noviherbaspirillum cavernae TaxID=2320862 RepID=A0A418WX40_9BURK|nr:FadR family transcriptional regulator [Noviherbaspirillum cavernae]
MLKETLLANLRSGQWGAGERLPAERQLSESHGIGRSTVRRALSQLKEMGVIEQAVGSGTFVTHDFMDRLPAQHPGATLNVSPAELMEARLMFEPVLIDLVVRNGTAADFADMEECCRQGEQAATLEQFEYWDGAFHQRLANATHNNFVISVFDLINKVRECGEWGVLKKKSVTPERRSAYQVEHRALLAALKSRDAETARQAMQAHLLNVRRNLFGY